MIPLYFIRSNAHTASLITEYSNLRNHVFLYIPFV